MAPKSIKEYRASRFCEIRSQSQSCPPRQVITALTALADEILETLYQQVLDAQPKLSEGFTIVALGGYGRGELSPYSDLDIMFLYQAPYQKLAEHGSKKILPALWDSGFRVGHSFRNIKDAITIARSDITVRTALMESRFVSGNKTLFEQFTSRFHYAVSLRNTGSYIKAKMRERAEECEKHGTVLEPHVKLSPGGLRDIHLFRWIAQSQHQTASLERLKDLGVLSKADYQSLSEAQEFFWQIRNDLHFTAKQCQDILTFDDQIRLATLYGFKDKPHLSAVEQFMTQYYEKTIQIRDITMPIIEQMRPKTILFYMKHIFRPLFGVQ